MKIYKYEKTQGLQRVILFIIELIGKVKRLIFFTLNFHQGV